MKRSCLALIAPLALIMPTMNPAAAQSPDTEDTQPPATMDSARRDHNAGEAGRPGRVGRIDRPSRPGRRPRSQAPDTPLELARKLPKLKVLMWETLELDADQKETISELFDEEIDRLKAVHAEAQGADARQEKLDEARDLQKALMEARKAGDRQRARQLRQELGRVLGASRRGAPQPVRIVGFLRKVNDELNDSQRSEFRGLVRKAGIRIGRGGRGRPLMAFRRALFSPEVNLSEDQRREVMQMMRDFRARFNPGRRPGGSGNPGRDAAPNGKNGDQAQPAPGDREEQIKQLQQAVLELLDAQQRERFEATLEKMKNDPPEPFRRRRSRGPGQGRPRDRGEF
ncbi:MAG: hypothetical protein ACE5E5_04770 [Phycisphaerae bacterium]